MVGVSQFYVIVELGFIWNRFLVCPQMLSDFVLETISSQGFNISFQFFVCAINFMKSADRFLRICFEVF